MNTAVVKPHSTLSRLHLGCGESLSQLLTDQPAPVVAPKVMEDATCVAPKPQPEQGGKQ